MAVCPLILNFLHISSQKWLVFANYFGLPNFLPQLANFFTRIYPSYPWHFPTLIGEFPQKIVPFVPLSKCIYYYQSIAFTFFCHFLLLYNSNFLLSVNFSETIWILSFLSDICDVTLACYDGGCCNVLRIEYPDSWNFKEGKFWVY